MAANTMEQAERAIFVGPSLYGVNVDHLPSEIWKGPAKAGDIADTVRLDNPRQIVLIDGLFHQSLAVWHKELVFALLEGVACIGAASMGALRAAEMHRYGMIGVGKIFQMYRDGEEDDSLVAMDFEPGTYRPLRESPIGSDLKRQDALEAIEFARSYRGTVKTSLTKDAINPYLERILERIA
jgi:hypothetical protein